MADVTLAGFKDRYAEIDRRLDAELSDGDRASVKAEIIGLFRTVEQAVAELTAFKEEIRALVEKWKAQMSGEKYDEALALGPNLIEAYYEMGRAYWFNGRKHEAIDAWKRGLAANRYNSWAKRCAELLERVDAGGEPSRT